jgi:phosphonoacetaldehyde hydrolase
MVWLNAIRMNVAPIESIVKVDDTVDGIREGLSAGCWTIAVARTVSTRTHTHTHTKCQGNYMAATEAQLDAMDKKVYAKRLQHAYDLLIDAGAHYVIDSVADIIPVN